MKDVLIIVAIIAIILAVIAFAVIDYSVVAIDRINRTRNHESDFLPILLVKVNTTKSKGFVCTGLTQKLITFGITT